VIPNPTPSPSPSPTVPPQVSYFSTFGFDAASGSNDIFAIWQTPDVPSTSQVLYGLSPDNLDHVSMYDPSLVKSHGIAISGLQSQTTYYLQSVSFSADGKSSYSQVISKTTK
jgi:hypothetical protein